MAEHDQKVMSWGRIVAIVLGTGLAIGLLLGLLTGMLGVSSSWVGAAMGGSMGVLGAILIARRGALLAKLHPADRPRAVRDEQRRE